MPLADFADAFEPQADDVKVVLTLLTACDEFRRRGRSALRTDTLEEPMFDLGPAADEMARLVAGVRDDQLDCATPCPDCALGDLLAHVHQFARVFTANAAKAPPPAGRRACPTTGGTSSRCVSTTWPGPGATRPPGRAGCPRAAVDMTGEENAVVAIEELVVHGWDVARVTGQELEPSSESLGHVERFLEIFAAPLASGQGPSDPPSPVGEDASRLERYLGAAGRDPGWVRPEVLRADDGLVERRWR